MRFLPACRWSATAIDAGRVDRVRAAIDGAPAHRLPEDRGRRDRSRPIGRRPRTPPPSRPPRAGALFSGWMEHAVLGADIRPTGPRVVTAHAVRRCLSARRRASRRISTMADTWGQSAWCGDAAAPTSSSCRSAGLGGRATGEREAVERWPWAETPRPGARACAARCRPGTSSDNAHRGRRPAIARSCRSATSTPSPRSGQRGHDDAASRHLARTWPLRVAGAAAGGGFGGKRQYSPSWCG